MRLMIYGLLLAVIVAACGSDANSSAPASTTLTAAAGYQGLSELPDADRTLESPDIRFTIPDLPDGPYNLLGYFTEKFYAAIESEAKGGKITFKREEPLKPGLYYMHDPATNTAIQLLVDADQTFEMQTTLANPVEDMVVKGSLDNELLYQSLVFEDNINAQIRNISERIRTLQPGSAPYATAVKEQLGYAEQRRVYLDKLFKQHPKTFFTAFKESGQNPNLDQYYLENGMIDTIPYILANRRQFWDNVNFADPRLMYTPVINNKLKRYFTEVMAQNPDTINKYADLLLSRTPQGSEYFKYFANWIALQYEPTKTSLMDAEAVFVHMVKNYFTKEKAFWADSMEVYGLQLRAHEMGNSLVGQKGPNVTAADPAGNMKSIYDLTADYIAVYLWNPECEHCAEQTPLLIDYYKKTTRKEFDVYAIVVNTEKDKWTNAIKKYGMPWTNVHDPTNKAFYATYYVDNTPEIYILNKDRKIIGKNLKVFQIDTIIDRDKENR